jgi:hypothetical protein
MSAYVSGRMNLEMYQDGALEPQPCMLSSIRLPWRSVKPVELSAGILLRTEWTTYTEDFIELSVLSHFVGLNVEGGDYIEVFPSSFGLRDVGFPSLAFGLLGRGGCKKTPLPSVP